MDAGQRALSEELLPLLEIAAEGEVSRFSDAWTGLWIVLEVVAAMFSAEVNVTCHTHQTKSEYLGAWGESTIWSAYNRSISVVLCRNTHYEPLCSWSDDAVGAFATICSG
jgi:hypothetical protein